MEIWLGQYPLQIVGSFVVQLSKPANQANLIHISLDIRGSLKQCLGVLNSRKVFGSLQRTFSGMVSVTCYVWRGREYENMANDSSKRFVWSVILEIS